MVFTRFLKLKLFSFLILIIHSHERGPVFTNSKDRSRWHPLFNDSANPSGAYPTRSNSRQCSQCSCGYTNPISQKIVGGVETRPLQYPWVAMMLYKNQFYCGASLINDWYVLTAGHCVRGFVPYRISLRFLTHSRTAQTVDTINRRVIKVIEHPQYNPRTFDNDLALIKLNEVVNFNEMLRPVCLTATTSETFAGQRGISIGWGATSENGELANSLREVTVPILSNDECSKTGLSITENMLCAGEKAGKKDSCQGDSGGPFHVITSANRFQQVGIVSWGQGCAEPNAPGVYTRLSNYFTWIRNRTQDGCYCS